MLHVTSSWFSCFLLPFIFVEVHSGSSSPKTFLNNVVCHVYPKIVPVDHPSYRYRYTFFVTLQRCQGADSNPKRHICKATKQENVNITVYKQDNTEIAIPVSNHTECDFVCKLDQSTCNVHEKWDVSECMCMCQEDKFDCVSPDKEWVKTDCKCMCKRSQCQNRGEEVDPDTCECVKAQKSGKQCGNVDAVAVKYVVVIALVELAVVLVLCVLIYRVFCYKRNGSSYSYSSSTNKQNDETPYEVASSSNKETDKRSDEVALSKAAENGEANA